MNYDIYGIVLVAIGFWLFYNFKKNHEDMSITLSKKKKLNVLDKEKLNKIMVIQNIISIIFCLIFGVLIIIFNNSLLLIIIIIVSLVMNIIFDAQRNKYII